MDLLFLRHGIAIDREDPKCPPNDFDRALTKEGRRKMAEATRGMAALGLAFDRIVSSPLVRARETAEIVFKGISKAPKVEISDLLAPGMDVEEVVAFLGKTGRARDTVVVVGHEPDFGDAVAQLAFGKPSDTFSLKKGGLACVELASTSPPVQGRLLWLLTPKLLWAAAGASD